jgi:hypothetical protein
MISHDAMRDAQRRIKSERDMEPVAGASNGEEAHLGLLLTRGRRQDETVGLRLDHLKRREDRRGERPALAYSQQLKLNPART